MRTTCGDGVSINSKNLQKNKKGDSAHYLVVFKRDNSVSLLYGHRLFPTDCEHFAAYTASELLELLPLFVYKTPKMDFDNPSLYLVIMRCVDGYELNYRDDTGLREFLLDKSIYDREFIEALSKMLIYLKEKELV